MTRSPVCLKRMLLGVVALFALAPSVSWAQLTARQLLAPAVAEIGPQYQDVEKAVAAFRSGKLDEARRLLQVATKKSPHLAPADVMLAQLMFSARQMPATRVLLEKTVVDFPDDPESYNLIGELALRERRLTEAEYMFAKGRDLCRDYNQNPRRQKSMLNNSYAGLAAVVEARKDWDSAVKRLETWIASDTENASAHLRLAQALFHLKQFKPAAAAFAKAHEFDQRQARAEVNLALMYDQAGDRAQAKRLIEEAAQKGAGELNTRLAVGRWALGAGDFELARANADAALKLEPNSLPARLLCGMTARYEGNMEAAIKDFSAALELSPENALAMNQLALVLVESADKPARIQALGLAHLNAQINSDVQQASGREAAVTLTWVLNKLGHAGPALRRLQSVLAAGSVSSESAYYAAQMYLGQGQAELAEKILAQALAQPANFPGRGEADKLLSQLREKSQPTSTRTSK